MVAPRCHTELEEAVGRISYLAKRWDNTPEWHDPPFLVGTIKIKITTGDLRDISTGVKSHDQLDRELVRLSELRVQPKRWSSLAERAVAAHTVGDDGGADFEAELEELKKSHE